MKFITRLLIAVLLIVQTAFAQEPKETDWVQKMLNPESNFYDVQAAFYEYWRGKEVPKGKGYKPFKRYEEFMKPRVYPTGYLPNNLIQEELNQIIERSSQMNRSMSSSNWTAMGPTNVPVNGLGYAHQGIGRINCIRFDPQNSNIIWIGTPGGGLWKSTNAGTSWTSNTDGFSTLGVSDVAIHPTNSNIMYIATGDADAGDTYSIGVLKSTDAGATWSSTGLTFQTSSYNRIGRLLINPVNPDVLVAFTNNGIYRTSNAGVSWTNTLAGNIFFDGEFKPGDPNIVYAAGFNWSGTAKMYYSTNGGTSFTQATGLPSSDIVRMSVAVSPASPNTVYVLAADGNYGYKALYKSTNSGSSYTQVNNTPNVLSGDELGSDMGGQGWYDLALAVSPLDANLIYVGGINVWKSTNGGTSFTITGHWYAGNSGTLPYVHADQHIFEFQPNTSTIFSGNDGGIRKSTNGGSSWTDLSNGLQITQFYRLSSAATDATITYAGAQDNGTNRHINGAWRAVFGGDGMQSLVDYTNSNIVYASYQFGALQRSTNGGASFTNITPSAAPDGAWITPYVLHPNTNTTIFAGYDRVYKSTNSGSTWTALTANLSGGELHEILKISASNPDVMYAGNGSKLFRTNNGGSTWTSIATGLPVGQSYLTEVAISNTDPNKIWATFSGYNSSNKVFYSSNGGSNWTNISAGLPNLPVNCIVYENNSNDAIYIGTDVGVYYKSNSVAWTPFMTNLPNVKVSDLEIHYGASKIRAATYGRGLWESPLNVVSVAPLANFTANQTTVFTGTPITLSDNSSNTPTAWKWTMNGATPSSATTQNVNVVYNTPGTYDVKLVVTNSAGSDSITKLAYITVNQVGQVSCINWNTQASGFTTASRGINDFNIVNQNIAWAVAYDGSGANSTIRDYTKTTNAGATWTPGAINTAGLGTSYGLANIHAYNADTAWASVYPVAASNTLQGVYYTTNGGTTWTRQSTASFSTAASFINVVHFFNKLDGVALGDPADGYLEFYTTNNGGTTWTRVAQGNIPAVLAADEYGTVGYFTTLGNTIWYPTYKGRIFKSIDKGLTWTVSNGPFPNVNSIVDLSFKDQNNGLMICNSGTGNNGLIYSTSNGGSTWSLVNTSFNTIVDKNAIAYVPGTSNTYYISGANASTSSTGTAYSTDGGLNWTMVDNIQHTVIRAYDASTIYSGGFNTNSSTGGIFKLSASNLTANITAFAPTAICPGDSTYIITDFNANYSYQWYRDGIIIPNANSNEYYAKQSGEYNVEVDNGTCSVLSATVLITVLNQPAIPVINGPYTFCTGEPAQLSTNASANNYVWYKNGNIIPNENSNTINVTEAGTYKVEVFDLNNCSNISADVVVSIVDKPLKAFVSPSTTDPICDGDTIVLNLSTNASVQWYKNSSMIPNANQPDLLVSEDGAYYAVLSTAINCTTNTDTFMVSFNALPTKPSIAQTDSVLNTDPNYFAYQWYLGGVEIANTDTSAIHIDEEGEYTVEVFDSTLSCSNISDNFLAQFVGLNSDKYVLNANVRPNPNTGKFYIDIQTQQPEVLNVEIINVLGQVMKSMRIQGSPSLQSIEMEYNQPGIYVIRIHNSSSVFEQKIIIQE